MVSALSRFTTLFLSKYVNHYLSKPVFRHFLIATQALFVLRALRIAVADLCFQYSHVAIEYHCQFRECHCRQQYLGG